jgi:hypothetical protein
MSKPLESRLAAGQKTDPCRVSYRSVLLPLSSFGKQAPYHRQELQRLTRQTGQLCTDPPIPVFPESLRWSMLAGQLRDVEQFIGNRAYFGAEFDKKSGSEKRAGAFARSAARQ